MDIKVLRQIIQGRWLMEPVAARQWAAVAAKILSGEMATDDVKAGIPAKWDVRNAYGEFFRVDSQGNYAPKGATQVIMMDGPVMKYDYCGAAGSQTVAHAIQAANADGSIESILLYMDSPGGSVDGTESLANVVRNSQKPVVAYVNSMMASAAYWIGSGARAIVADGSNNGYAATIGSIGTMASWIDKTGMYEAQGAKVHEVYATKSVDKNADFHAMNKGDYTSLIQDVLDPLNESFLGAVKQNRSGKIDLSKENVLTGKTYNAKDALKYGLIDKIGTFEQAIQLSLSLAKKEKKNMETFQHTLAAAQSEAFEVVDNGFLLTEEHLNNVEAQIMTLSTSTATTQQANIDLTQQLAVNTTQLEAANAEHAAAQARIAELEAEVSRLQALTPAPAITTKDQDDFGADSEEKYFTSVDREAARLRALKKQ